MFDEVFEYKYLKNADKVNVIGLNKKVQIAYIWNFFRATNKTILLVTNTLYEANNLYKALAFYDDSTMLFPMDDFIVSERLAISPDLMLKRIEVLNELCQSAAPRIIITNYLGYLRYLPSKKIWESLNINIKINDEIKRKELIEKLEMLGYEKETIVTKTGEYAIRGYILDIFPYGYENPIRLEYFDDLIEEMKTFDPETQLSKEKIENIKIEPSTEFINVKNDLDIPKRQSLLPKVCSDISNLCGYINDYIMFYFNLDSIKNSYINLLNEIVEYKKTDEYKVDKYMYDFNEIVEDKYINIIDTDNMINKKNVELYSTKEIEKYNNNFEIVNSFLNKEYMKKSRIIVCLDSNEMINDFISKIKLPSIITDINNLYDDKINIVNYKLLSGFIINNTVFLSANEIYKRNIVVKYKSKFRYGSKIRNINKLEIGDYIVHQMFGIGRYLGIVTLSSKGLVKDYIYLQYANTDKLYIPVENIEYISKYISKEGVVPKLNKLGGTDWVKQKARVKSKIKDIAKELLMLSAKRKMAKGFAFLKDDKRQYEFEEQFAYQETKDQLKVTEEIKEDMEKPIPMDRLLCGDVGFGKTEVAFRAAFKAIESGKQVAFLCPTTILSMQHYDNAISRFDGFGINIEVLNRFVSTSKKNQILNDLKTGKTDLIIGTHRLLSNDIEYKDLGLLIIDEEQRFGVTHKEKIKKYKENIDILTLSATPIPRTLQMSLTNVRSLSLIETPPLYRYPIQTYVLKEDNQVIKDAIYKELSREGQVFILYNKVSKMEEKLNEIKRLVPEIRITYVHGQMNKNEIEDTMEKFIKKEYDILLCSTIIETGIDIQNVNTLIVYDADTFGLSQLYQIRGRIGRGNNIAYAYLMYKTNKELNDIAQKRLNAIKEFTELGSGYALAIRDLSIRGAGDILGAQQSGFIDTVGYDMYIKILNEEVERLTGVKTKDNEQEIEKPFIQVNTHISEKYATDEDLKIEIHRMINNIDSYNSLIKIKKELEDRFGKLDEEIIIYMLEELFQYMAKNKGVSKVIQNEKEVSIYFSSEKSKSINGAYLLSKLFKINKAFNVTYKNNIITVNLKLESLNKHFIYYLVKMINIIE